MIPALDALRLAELGCLILHEAHDEERLTRVRGRIKGEGVQRNPVMVSPFEEGFLVLDGAHRVHALRDLKARLALVQVVEPPASVESWAHLLTTAGIEKLHELEAVEVSEGGSQNGGLAEVQTAGKWLSVSSRERGLTAEVRALWAMQEAYPGDSEVRRVGADDSVSPPDEGAIVRYRTFSPGELAEVVRLGAVLPAGITRFRFEERVLGVRFPLRSLRSGDAAARNAELKSFVQERWRENRVRRYAEPTVLFE